LRVAARIPFWSVVLLSLLLTAAFKDSTADEALDFVTQLKPNVSHGRDLFDTCAACHGNTGAGVSDGTVPAIAGQHFHVIVAAIIDFRNDNRLDPRMKHFTDEHHLSVAQDIADVAAYVSRLQPTRSSAHGDGSHVARGSAIYQTDCISCHGPQAKGSDKERYPRLAGQHYEYLIHQLHDATDGRRPGLAHDHVQFLERLQLSDIIGVSDYLSRLGP
jgi:cytochrome c553